MKAKKVLAWHWTDGRKLRDGQPLVVGKLYKHDGPLVMCESGYHASVDIVDALGYAPGFTVSRVECSGEIESQDDKMVCTRRKVLWTVNARRAVLAWSVRVATDTVKAVKKVYKDKAWNVWADLWISGKDRTAAAAHAAGYAAANAANAAANAAHAANAADYAAANAAAATPPPTPPPRRRQRRPRRPRRRPTPPPRRRQRRRLRRRRRRQRRRLRRRQRRRQGEGERKIFALARICYRESEKVMIELLVVVSMRWTMKRRSKRFTTAYPASAQEVSCVSRLP